MFSKAKQPQTTQKDSYSSSTADPAPASSPAPSPAVASGGAVPSIISADLSINGDIKSTGDIQIDGEIKGDVNSKSLTVGESAHINGSITGDRIRICGSVTGTVRGPSVILAKTAKVLGDIVHESLEIEAGAFIEGNIMRMDSAKGQTNTAKTAAESSLGKASVSSDNPNKGKAA